ncbi:IclR family transcriptional regulator [Actinobacteria bacterium YIM 96077]|uniref:Glycerol operon regulatory protein n=1 Tax=Phytoactinopolyspora halophila TaxID=1981511 RepID=A0A329QTT4_9ACTN|nr:IclR family transcriptional regulator [Phytoactinopolyspora halophila]AYY14984.1 IclR family transcriptional regulator [Actinobacteria bacterium YIM 96077]RAW15441.1 IclR family transcriptional regulator [Phytoactinopolyspora halophila]
MIQSVDRSIRILTALQGARRMSLSEIAERLELPPPTVHGIVRTLVAHGMVVQDHTSGRYQLGPAVLRLGNVYLDTLELRSRAVTWAEELGRRTGFAVRVGVPLAEDVIIIHHEPRPDGTRQMPEVGIVIPTNASALGKAMLAFLPDAADQLLAGPSLRSMTGETITDPGEFRKQLDDVRASGLAFECDEAVLGESSVAGTVFDGTDLAVGAVAIVVPTSEWPVDDGTVDAVRTTARTVSRELGASRWPAG